MVSNRLFCIHGGLSPSLEKFDQIRSLTLPLEVDSSNYNLTADLLWSDPDPSIDGKFGNRFSLILILVMLLVFRASHRGVSYVFGPKQVKEFCDKLKVDLIVRGHQVTKIFFDV